jgi:hypothetical protein
MQPEIRGKIGKLKEAVVATLDSRSKELIDISLEIHRNSRTLFQGI